MKVYELIQELAQYEADQDVYINVVAEKYPLTVEVEEDVAEGEKTEVSAEFDEDIEEFDIDEPYNRIGRNKVRINVLLE